MKAETVFTPQARKVLLDGLHSWIAPPGKGTGGTSSARYCYSVFLRHRVLAARHGMPIGAPRSVVELGPGDSLGIGLMALLTGSQRYIAIDAVRHATPQTNLEIFDGLVDLLRARAPVPQDGDCAHVCPSIDDTHFPAHLLDDFTLDAALAPERLQRLRDELVGNAPAQMVSYLAPWGEISAVPDNSVDWIFSQAVFEHVDQPAIAYQQAARSLRTGGMSTHQIDYRCHDTAPQWNGHWRYPKWLWRIMRGNRPWFINRLAHSDHLRLHQQAGLAILEEVLQKQRNAIARTQLAGPFSGLSADDLETSSAMIISKKRGGMAS